MNPFRMTGMIALVLAAANLATPLASAADSKPGTTFSESVAVRTPNENIVGTTSGTDLSPETARADQQLLDKVMKGLLADKDMDGAKVRVNVEKGAVTLDGSAKDKAQADHVRSLAQSAAGGASVTSNLQAQG